MKLCSFILMLGFTATACLGAPTFDWGTTDQFLRGYDGSFLLGNKTASVTALRQLETAILVMTWS